MVHGPLQPLVAPRRASVRSRAPRAHSFLSDSAGGPSNGGNGAVRFDRKIVHRSIHVQPLANAAREPAGQASQRRRRPRTRSRPSAPAAAQLGSLTDAPSATSPRWLSCFDDLEDARSRRRRSPSTARRRVPVLARPRTSLRSNASARRRCGFPSPATVSNAPETDSGLDGYENGPIQGQRCPKTTAPSSPELDTSSPPSDRFPHLQTSFLASRHRTTWERPDLPSLGSGVHNGLPRIGAPQRAPPRIPGRSNRGLSC